MGFYVNPGFGKFLIDIDDAIYVDKSEMISDLNKYVGKRDRFICMSRARRFGKTMMTNLMAAYYSKGCDSRHIFEKFKLARHEGWDKYLNSVNVIMIDLNGEYSAAEDKSKVIKAIQANVLKDLRKTFPTVELPMGTSVAEAIAEIYDATGDTFIIIIDEYDVLIREKVDEGLRKEYLDFLNSLFKNNRLTEVIKLAYLTGILPIIREKVQSKLNNFSEITMLDPGEFAPHFGFTEDEVKELCEKHGRDYNQCKMMYDGYSFPGIEHIFNPTSVVRAISKGCYKSYWTPTSSREAITDYLNQNIEGIQEDITTMLEGGVVEVDTSKYMNDIEVFTNKNSVFTYLSHLGYLAYDSDSRTCRIPNMEIQQEWINAMELAKGFDKVMKVVNASRNLVSATISGDEKTVATALDEAHRKISSHLTFNREASLQSAILMAYFYAVKDYMIFSELPAGDGFADVALIPTSTLKPAIIIELKKEGKPEKAIEQIKSRHYASVFKDNPGKGILLVGISYDAKEGKHLCKIERMADVSEVWKQEDEANE